MNLADNRCNALEALQSLLDDGYTPVGLVVVCGDGTTRTWVSALQGLDRDALHKALLQGATSALLPHAGQC